MIRFGAWSAILFVLAAQCTVLAILIARKKTNRRANLFLAALMVAIAGLLVPFVLGYAGGYDAFPFLSYAPFAVPLAVGPLLYFHVGALTGDGSASRAHFIAPAAQFLYQAMLFPFPVETKDWFDGAIQQPVLSPILTLAVPASMAAYAMASWLTLRRYEDWLTARRRSPVPARRIRFAATMLTILAAARAAYALFDLAVRDVDYFDLFGFYILLALIGLALGIDGWRQADAPAPAMTEPAERDWRAQGDAWLARLRKEGGGGIRT